MKFFRISSKTKLRKISYSERGIADKALDFMQNVMPGPHDSVWDISNIDVDKKTNQKKSQTPGNSFSPNNSTKPNVSTKDKIDSLDVGILLHHLANPTITDQVQLSELLKTKFGGKRIENLSEMEIRNVARELGFDKKEL